MAKNLLADYTYKIIGSPPTSIIRNHIKKNRRQRVHPDCDKHRAYLCHVSDVKILG